MVSKGFRKFGGFGQLTPVPKIVGLPDATAVFRTDDREGENDESPKVVYDKDRHCLYPDGARVARRLFSDFTAERRAWWAAVGGCRDGSEHRSPLFSPASPRGRRSA